MSVRASDVTCLSEFRNAPLIELNVAAPNIGIVIIDPEDSGQQDAIDMFVVCNNAGSWQVLLAMQDTIGKTHSFHPIKILEYRTAVRARPLKPEISDKFFLHVVVVPDDPLGSSVCLKWATMPLLMKGGQSELERSGVRSSMGS